jgi:hypothetical protein
VTYWDVQVFGGVQPDAEQLASAPVKFGTPQVTLGFDGSMSDQTIPLVYGPVELETMSVTSLSLWGNPMPDGSRRALHVMDNVWHVTFGGGFLAIEGLEVRRDGVAVHSRWEATPTDPPEEVQKMLREAFGEEG